MTQRDESYIGEEIRQVGDFRIRLSRSSQPAGWAFVQVLDMNGA